MNTSDQTENEDYERNMQDRFRMISADLRRYVEKRIELVQLEIADRLSIMMARSVHKLFGLAFVVFSYVFFMMALAQYIGPLLGHPSLGYLIVGGITGFLGLLLSAVKPDSLSRRMQRSWFQQVFGSESENAVSESGRNRATKGGANGHTRKSADKDSNDNQN